MPGTMLLGYDVESSDPEITRPFLNRARELHNRLGVPATLFIVGQTLEQSISQFQEISADPLFDFQQHTYSHKLLKSLHIDDGKTIRVVRGVGPDEAREEVRKTVRILKERLGVDCIGLTGPWTYYRGLRDRPDLLEMLWEEGIRFIRTDGRNEKDWHPVAMDVQPYWYDQFKFWPPSGRPEPSPTSPPPLLEIPTHGWHDCVIRAEVLGWQDLDGWTDSVVPYIDRAASGDLVFSQCQHDWSSTREDPQMRATDRLLRYALDSGLSVMTCKQFYEERQSAKVSAEAA